MAGGSTNKHDTLSGAYVQGLRDLLAYGAEVPAVEDPYSIGSDFGQRPRSTLELLGYTFEVSNPRACLVFPPGRSLRLAYCVGLFLWTVAGSDDQEWIGYYNPQAGNFSDDGRHIAAAFGRRLFAYEGRIDQLDSILKQISVDAHSRRTVGVIASPQDNEMRSRGYPCAIAVQYLQRNDTLHTITFMRSQSALMVLPYDGFLFMTIQRWLASRMGLALGSYTHVAGSFHIYEDEIPLARRTVRSRVDGRSLGQITNPESGLESLLAFERAVRSAALGESRSDIQDAVNQQLQTGTDDTSFFTQARLILLAYASERLQLFGDSARVQAALSETVGRLPSTERSWHA